MAHIFSVEIHDYLSARIQEAEEGRREAGREGNDELQRYFEGRLLELHALRQYLTDKIDLKTHIYY